MGSGLKWATCNLGATAPEEFGDYFAWGETEPKDDGYSWSTYQFGTSQDGPFSKYVINPSEGTVDYKDILDPEEDAACVNLGGSWRIPTADEWNELIGSCSWTWTTENGVAGMLVIGPNENSIFLPAAGYMFTTVSSAGTRGYYWSSTLTNISSSAWNVNFGNSSSNVHTTSSSRYRGFSIRPVTE